MGRARASAASFMRRSGVMASAQSRAARSNPFVGCACMNGSQGKKRPPSTLDLTWWRSCLRACMRPWIAVEAPRCSRRLDAHEQTDSRAFAGLMRTKWVRVRRERVLARIATPEWSVSCSRASNARAFDECHPCTENTPVGRCLALGAAQALEPGHVRERLLRRHHKATRHR